MKNKFTAFLFMSLILFSSNSIFAQEDSIQIKNIENTEVNNQETSNSENILKNNLNTLDNNINDTNERVKSSKEKGFKQTLKDKFKDGGPIFMFIVLLCLIIGLALCIERIIYLNLATTKNSDKLLNEIESSISSNGIDGAKDICRNTRGPIASIFYQGLDRSSQGIDQVEKSIVAYGGVQMGLLEKGLSWISLFIALAPMLGFMGTVLGMIEAFEAIEAKNNISAKIVAGGIGKALITTVFGLIVAIILQIFYNYIISKIDGIVNEMEDASIKLIDILVNNKTEKSSKKKK